MKLSQDQNKPKSGRQSHQKDFQEDYAWIKKAVLYPYNKEMHSLVRYRDLLAFEIVGVADPIGKGMVGKDAGKVIGEPVRQICGLARIFAVLWQMRVHLFLVMWINWLASASAICSETMCNWLLMRDAMCSVFRHA